jgi:hypothetical protein
MDGLVAGVCCSRGSEPESYGQGVSGRQTVIVAKGPLGELRWWWNTQSVTTFSKRVFGRQPTFLRTPRRRIGASRGSV